MIANFLRFKFASPVFLIKFFKVLGIILFIASLLISVIFYSQYNTYLQNISAAEKAKINQAAISISKDLSATSSDLLFLANLLSLKTSTNGSSDFFMLNLTSKSDLEHIFLKFALHKSIYDQIRFLDLHGNEIIRINYNNGFPTVVSKNNLQNKKDRYYFEDALPIERGSIYVSNFDLNIEQQQLELPFKPMLRLATPTFDPHGNKTGLLLLNYLGENLLESLSRSSRNYLGQPELLNSAGYWLSSSDKTRSWGFMFENKQRETYANYHPEAWSIIENNSSGQFYTEDGLFTFLKIDPFNESLISTSGANHIADKIQPVFSSKENYWIITSLVSTATLNNEALALKQRCFIIISVFFVLSLILSYVYARNSFLKEKYNHKLKFLANHDPLTGLPNRINFIEKLEQSIANARLKQQQLGVLFIDLDGFKLVNDLYGHRIGDFLLIEVGKRLQECIGPSDMVARLGGDEFIVLLENISLDNSLITLNKKITATLNRPFVFDKITCNIGSSIGNALFPTDGLTADILISTADNEMYLKKAQKKQPQST